MARVMNTADQMVEIKIWDWHARVRRSDYTEEQLAVIDARVQSMSEFELQIHGDHAWIELKHNGASVRIQLTR